MVEMTCVHCRKTLSAKDATLQYPRSKRSAHRRCMGDLRPESIARMDALILASPSAHTQPQKRKGLPKHLARFAR